MRLLYPQKEQVGHPCTAAQNAPKRAFCIPFFFFHAAIEGKGEKRGAQLVALCNPTARCHQIFSDFSWEISFVIALSGGHTYPASPPHFCFKNLQIVGWQERLARYHAVIALLFFLTLFQIHTELKVQSLLAISEWPHTLSVYTHTQPQWALQVAL